MHATLTRVRSGLFVLRFLPEDFMDNHLVWHNKLFSVVGSFVAFHDLGHTASPAIAALLARPLFVAQ